MNGLRSPSYLAMLYDRSYLRAEGSYGGEALNADCAIEENFSSVYGAGFDVFNTKLILNKLLSRRRIWRREGFRACLPSLSAFTENTDLSSAICGDIAELSAILQQLNK